MKIGHVIVGSQILVIAEIGNNHLGDIDLAHKHLAAAADAGVDAVKFQMFTPDLLVAETTPVYKHVPDRRFNTQRERFRVMSLSREEYEGLARHARDRGILFMCTAFDQESADFLEPLVPAFKVASGDSSFFPLIDYIVEKGKPLLVSTGLCHQHEVDSLADRLPRDRTLLFHCVGAYPTPDEETCLSLIPFYRDRYRLPVGFSDHTPDHLAALGAVTLGATAVEKHFILNKDLPGGDRVVSLIPEQMKKLVEEIRRLESMIGYAPRALQPSEIYGRRELRRSAYNASAAKKGDILKMKDIVFLRPELKDAYSPKDFPAGSTLRVTCDLEKESPLTPQNTEWIYQ